MTIAESLAQLVEFVVGVDDCTRNEITGCPLDAKYSTSHDEAAAVACAEMAIAMRARLGLPSISRPPHALAGDYAADPDPPFDVLDRLSRWRLAHADALNPGYG